MLEVDCPAALPRTLAVSCSKSGSTGLQCRNHHPERDPDFGSHRCTCGYIAQRPSGASAPDEAALAERAERKRSGLALRTPEGYLGQGFHYGLVSVTMSSQLNDMSVYVACADKYTPHHDSHNVCLVPIFDFFDEQRLI